MPRDELIDTFFLVIVSAIIAFLCSLAPIAYLLGY
jgi:hypothetical protein